MHTRGWKIKESEFIACYHSVPTSNISSWYRNLSKDCQLWRKTQRQETIILNAKQMTSALLQEA